VLFFIAHGTRREYVDNNHPHRHRALQQEPPSGRAQQLGGVTGMRIAAGTDPAA